MRYWFVSGRGFSRAANYRDMEDGFSRCRWLSRVAISDPKSVIAGARTFFVTASTQDKRHTLQSDRSASLFLKVLYEYRDQSKFRLHEFVVMPDHFHVLLTVESGMTIERAVQFIKGGFSFRAGKELGVSSPFWQKGFSEIRILDASTFNNAVRYIQNNPVEAHLVQFAAEYPHSPAHSGFELDPPPPWLKAPTAPEGDSYGADVRHG